MLLCAAKSMGVDFETTVTIGRQWFFPDQTELRRVFATLGIDNDAERFLEQNKYSEDFFKLLGARHIDSVDVSSYEKATILHDMNLPIPDQLKERFSLVHDGGTIEHVFNVTQAFKNCMEMVRVGGHFTQVNAANNFTGHGFWQFSPELIFRLFSPQNGYQLEAVLMHEVIPGGAWYLVSDPDHMRQRVELCNSLPTYILTIAKRIASVPVLERIPQQSDYAMTWNDALNPTPRRPPPMWRLLWQRHIPQPVKRVLKSIHHIVRPFGRAGYRRITDEQLLRGRLPS